MRFSLYWISYALFTNNVSGISCSVTILSCKSSIYSFVYVSVLPDMMIFLVVLFIIKILLLSNIPRHPLLQKIPMDKSACLCKPGKICAFLPFSGRSLMFNKDVCVECMIWPFGIFTRRRTSTIIFCSQGSSSIKKIMLYLNLQLHMILNQLPQMELKRLV